MRIRVGMLWSSSKMKNRHSMAFQAVSSNQDIVDPPRPPYERLCGTLSMYAVSKCLTHRRHFGLDDRLRC